MAFEVEWSTRSEFWRKRADRPELTGQSGGHRQDHSARRALTLSGMGLRLSVERGALRVVDGFTHYPQERRDLLFFPADRKLPSRIVIVDGKGSISIDALAWLAEQRVPLVRVNWRGEATFAIGGAAAQLDPERIAWQVEARRDETRRAAFVRDLLRDKIAACLRTLEMTAPPSKAKDGALGLHQVTLQNFAESAFDGLSIDALRTLEARCAAAYRDAAHYRRMRDQGRDGLANGQSQSADRSRRPRDPGLEL